MFTILICALPARSAPLPFSAVPAATTSGSTSTGCAARCTAAAQRSSLHPVNWPGPVAAWLCIHSHEAAWTNNHRTWDGRWSDYEGGLQMDSGFQRTYGLDFMQRHHGLGAHAWTPREQMIAANRARIGVDWRGDGWPGPRGFGPWPNTARACGLR